MLLERIFFVIFLYEKSVPNIRIMFPKSKDFVFLDVSISMTVFLGLIKRLNAIVAT
jgi:hypothetical protein